ncbi:MAG: acetyl-CoA carboxylase biotin carboxyl carrier protein subunit [Bacteroidales bacterium]
MTFEIELNGRVRPVSVERDGDLYRVAMDGKSRLVDLARVDRSTLSLIFPERAASHEVAIVERMEPGELEVHLRPGVVYARLEGRTKVRRRAAAGMDPFAAGDGEQQIVAPMPGKVVRVLVSPGDDVKVRQGLVVVEAMKMENELRSPKDGRVKDVRVQQGMSVEAGRVLVVVE